jgi:predicted enzyme related to lactoylglutathione lyase
MAKWSLSPGDWCHIETLTADTMRARRFYGEVFGWQFEEIPGTDYLNVKTSEDGIEGGIGGLAQATETAPPATRGLFAYLLAPDMDATLAAIEKAGGEVVIPKTDVMGMGEFAHFRDPDGNLIGLWRDAPGVANTESANEASG